MTARESRFFQPTTLEDALAYLAEYPDTTPIAGGTDVMVVWRDQPPPASVLDLGCLKELRGIRQTANGVSIGAATTWSELAISGLVAEIVPLLARAAKSVAAAQVRNRGTIGGNIVNASPCADSLPSLLLHEATLVLRSQRGARRVPFDSFYFGYKRMDLHQDEILATVEVPPLPYTARLFWRSVGTRRAQSVTKLSLAGAVGINGEGWIEHARLAAGAVAPTVVRLPLTERSLIGHRLTQDFIEQTRMLAESEISPIDDLRGSAHYRRKVFGNLVQRFLTELM